MKVKSIKKISSVDLEQVLFMDVHGCAERSRCSSGCMDLEVEMLFKKGAKPKDIEKILDRWSIESVPTATTIEGGTGTAILGQVTPSPQLTLWRQDLDYKYAVLKKLCLFLSEEHSHY